MSNEQTPFGRKDIPAGTKVIGSPHLKRRWANRILVVVEQPKGARGVNYILSDPKDRDEQVRVPADHVRIYTGDKEFGYDDPNVTHENGVTRITYTPALHAGVVARVHGMRKIPDGTLLVSLGPSSRAGQTKVATLGGDNGRYWPGVPTENLTVVDVLSLIEAGQARAA